MTEKTRRGVAALGLALLLCAAAAVALLARQIQILPEKMTEYYTAPKSENADSDMDALLKMLKEQ